MGDRAAVSRRPGLGKTAEDLAVACLEQRGMTIAARNWRRPEGELDVVAWDHGTCVFVEVRSRTGEERGHPLEAVTARKRAQVVRAARLFLESEQTVAHTYRFDVVGVTFWEDGRSPTVAHVPDAFEAGGARG